ncbi:acetyl-CoA carboxylase biotin carboxyl carrier protein [Actinomycetospora chiangmaiensis]|uniref:acetyl-CoA carboxylase biotin carboxyl carrier protein n=1 Tax=Actinomycetospora chiangmaiensis TaxID=402650 RepID=UPI00038251CD|nr:biotin/lipoyl-containing protein [Actinomycetospora chiangmaiensis]
MSTAPAARDGHGTLLTSDAGTAPPAHDGAAPPPAELDAVLAVLVRHVRDLAPLGTVRVAAGAVTVEVGPGTPAPAAAPAPAPPPAVGPPVTEAAPAAVVGEGPTVCSTTVGVFYRAAEPGATPFVGEGDSVSVGQQIGIVEAMKLMIPLESDRSGTVAEFLVGDGEAVEHGQPVLRLVGDAGAPS